ncbi:unnamed protein product [Cuscuta epithymum]|uniref:Purine permease 3 n=1 Tax=Cuscuta epithymum TaxID=186058 RepID=A0AAV0C7B7_9ASTE|nr:unnamed protein product [Cuscuta epithymum]
MRSPNRRSPRRRQLRLLLWRGEASGVNVVPGHRHSARLHGRVRFPARETEVHGLFRQRRCFVDSGGGGVGRACRKRPAGRGVKECGFVLTVAAAALYGLILPLVELSYTKAKQTLSFGLVLEYQLIMGFVATVISTIGMLINKDFEAIPREAGDSELGEVKFYILIVGSVIVWQFFFVGAVGVISFGSSLLSGVIITVLLPVTEVFAVIFYHEKFQAEKGISLFLSIWGFVSYTYGEIKQMKKPKQLPFSVETQMMTSTSTAVVPSNQTV